jgi:circadian clock protein KaiC
MTKAAPLVSTGIAGLDDILGGGLPAHRLYLVQGDPGVGKTTAALQFLLAGTDKGEAALYVTLSETKEELESVAGAHGLSLANVTLYELAVAEETAQDDYTLFHPSEVELNETTRGVLDVVQRVKPQRVVFDSLSELRLLARDPLRYRRQILALKQFFIGRACTVLLLDDRTSSPGDLQLESLAHGVIDLEQLAPEYGSERRRLRIKKMRGVKFRGGYHDLKITTGGIVVFPRLVAAEHKEPFPAERLSSGVPALDRLTGGGLERGTSTLLMGPAGSGKTSLALQYAVAAIERGHYASLFLFEEGMRSLLDRARAFGWDLERHCRSGRLHLQQVDPAELSPGEFAHTVRREVEEKGARVVAIDSLNGYLSAMPADRHLSLHLHELLAFLNQCGVNTFLVMAQHGFLGSGMQTPADVSYLADTVLLLRYFESEGHVRQAISVVKKRGGTHERTIREFGLGAGGVHIGEPLLEFHGILTGVPVHRGPAASLMRSEEAPDGN